MSDLYRFLNAQEDTYSKALSEIKNGYKSGHWMWYIFPQVRGLGVSITSEYYGIDGIEEAKDYLKNPTLKNRLVEISEALLRLDINDATYIMGYPDDLKLKSSMTLFYLADGENDDSVFKGVLDKFYGGELDENTIKQIKAINKETKKTE